MVLRISYVNSEREDGPGNITSAAGKEKNAENEDKCLLLQTKNAKIKHEKRQVKSKRFKRLCSFTDIKQHAANLSSK